MKITTKIALVALTSVTILVSVVLPSFAYGGTEIRTDISSVVTNERINTPRIAIGWNQGPDSDGHYQGPSGHFIDNGAPWHNDRDYYGNGSISVTNYRDNPDSTYELPYIYNYYHRQGYKSYDTLTYTLPRTYNWLRCQFDIFYGHDNNAKEYISLVGNTTSMTVYYNYTILEYDTTTKEVKKTDIHENITVEGTNIPLRPPSLSGVDTAYNLVITMWSSSYNKITIGTAFDDEETMTDYAMRTSNHLYNAHKANYNPAPEFKSFWASLWGSLDAFLDIEIFPDFRLGTVLYIAFAFTALGIVLKYFAGG